MSPALVKKVFTVWGLGTAAQAAASVVKAAMAKGGRARCNDDLAESIAAELVVKTNEEDHLA